MHIDISLSNFKTSCNFIMHKFPNTNEKNTHAKITESATSSRKVHANEFWGKFWACDVIKSKTYSTKSLQVDQIKFEDFRNLISQLISIRSWKVMKAMRGVMERVESRDLFRDICYLLSLIGGFNIQIWRGGLLGSGVVVCTIFWRLASTWKDQSKVLWSLSTSVLIIQRWKNLTMQSSQFVVICWRGQTSVCTYKM